MIRQKMLKGFPFLTKTDKGNKNVKIIKFRRPRLVMPA